MAEEHNIGKLFILANSLHMIREEITSKILLIALL